MEMAKIVSNKGRQLTLAEKWEIDSRNSELYGYNEKGERVPADELCPDDGIDYTEEIKEGVTYTF